MRQTIINKLQTFFLHIRLKEHGYLARMRVVKKPAKAILILW